MKNKKVKQNQRLSTHQKNANNKQWYKDQADMLNTTYNSLSADKYQGISEYKRMKVNYDLFNNILNLSDFEYVCKPFGAKVGELPAKMVNRDIVSSKINAVLGMEMDRPFSWKVIATNPEATTRREQEEFKRIREYVVAKVMNPVRQQIEMQYQENIQGRELTQEEQEKIQQEVEQQTQSQTPQEVKKYMQREHQDPAEVLAHQLLEYLIKKCNVKMKFNTAFKHLNLSAKEVMYVGIFNGEPDLWNVNSLRFNYDMSPDNEFIEDGEWATCEYRMTPSEVIKYFGEELTQKEIDKVYEEYNYYAEQGIYDNLFSFEDDARDNDNGTVRVLHCVWKSLRKLKFLNYLDEQGKEQVMIVNEQYELDKEVGDISIEEDWFPEVYETWKIGKDIYVKMRPVPGQFKDLDNLYHCKLPYYGAICNNMNSTPTCIMDRLKAYQYYYNIVMYRLELLLASDKGKKVMMNINGIPDSAGIDIEKWQYFFESSPFMWFNPNEEGTGYQDVNTMAKQIDLSLASDIGKYIELAEYLRQQAGYSTGITDTVEGQTRPNEAVTNVKQSLNQSSYILESYFELHNHVKRNVLQALLEMSKVAYSNSNKKKLHYILDDMSRQIIDLDVGLLENSTLGLFVSNSSKAKEAKDLIAQLTHAAMQNQKVELSDMISVIRQEGIVEAEETLKAAEQNRREAEQAMQESQQQAIAEEEEKRRQFERERHEMNLEEIRIKEEERRKTEIIKTSLLGASYNPDADTDGDGENDFFEIAKYGLDAEIKKSKEQLEREKFEHQKEVDRKKLEQTDKKLSNEEKKIKHSQNKNTNS